MRACGLTITILKTRLLVAGRNITQNDLDPISIGGTIETVSSFRYLGSVVERHGGVCEELSVRVSHAAAVFGAFTDQFLVMVHCLFLLRVLFIRWWC